MTEFSPLDPYSVLTIQSQLFLYDHLNQGEHFLVLNPDIQYHFYEETLMLKLILLYRI